MSSPEAPPTAPPADLPARLATACLRLLPASRREWARGMEAELASVQGGRERWGFAVGCLRTTLREGDGRSTVAYPVVALASLVVVLLLTRRSGYAPMHWALVAMVVVLLALPLVARRVLRLGRTAEGAVPLLVRAGGCLLVGVAALTVVMAFRSTGGDNPSRLRSGVPIFTTLLGLYLLAFLAMTARTTSGRRVVLVVTAVSGAAGALAWLGLVAAAPPLPTTSTLALLLVAGSALVTWCAVPRPGRLVAALGTATLTCLAIVIEVHALMRFASERWVPDIGTMALTHAADVEQSRNEAGEPYLSLLFLGALLACGVIAATLAARQRMAGGNAAEPALDSHVLGDVLARPEGV